MEVVYTCNEDSSSDAKDWISEEKCCSSLSSQNVLAISRQKTGSHKRKRGNETSMSCEVGVFDLDKPWEWFTVTTRQAIVTNLQWNKTGTRLLITDSTGLCQVWQMQEHLVNNWECVGSSSLPGEDILAVAWFHTGVQILFSPEKKDAITYEDKFLRERYQPSVTQFGGKPVDGWIAVTASGLVECCVINRQEPYITSSHKSLSLTPQRLSLAAVAYSNMGGFVIATSDGQLSSLVQCFHVTAQLTTEGVQVTSKPTSSLHMKSRMEYSTNESQQMTVTNLTFMNPESCDTLIVSCGCNGYSSMEIWQLVEQHTNLHQLCQSSQGVDNGFKIHKWMHHSTIQHTSYLSCIATSKLPVKHVMETGFSPYIAAAYKDGSIKLIHRHNHQVLHTSADALRMHAVTSSPVKKFKKSVNITNLIQTFCGCGLIAVHDGKISVLKVYSVKDGAISMSALLVCLLFEYALVTGNDWWGILLAVKPGNIEAICQKLIDNFFKQLPAMQESVAMRLQALKVALYSTNFSSREKASDCHTRLVLQAINALFRCLLRPKNITSQDKSPGEKLSAVCVKSTDGDLDKVLFNLDKEEYQVDTKRRDKAGDGMMQSLKPLIQWIADFCLHLLASIPLYQSYPSFPGSSLLSDSSLLRTLRELLVIIRIWSTSSPSVAPIFTTTSNVDCLAHLYKVLTKAWLCCKDGSKLEYDETLLDECCVLPSKLLVPAMNQSFRLYSSGYTVFGQSFPVNFVWGEYPEYLYSQKKSKLMYVSDVLTENQQHHDIIRQIHLGVHLSENVRQCCRCGGFSLLTSVTKSSIMKAWEQRWQRHCLCAAHWKLYTENE